MPSLKASPEGLQRIQQARNERGLAIHNIQWLIEASKILQPHKNWATREENGRLAVSIGTWKRFLAGEAIRPAQFKAFCQVLAIDWQDVIHKAPKNATYGAKNDWGEAPDSSAFISRTAEIATLQQWIIGEKVRLVPILGSGGIGKTSLATKVAREIAEDFDSVIWRSLREAPPLEKILSDCIKLFSEHQSIDLPNTLEEQITALLDLLCSHRCLMVFDNLEALLQSGSTKGDYQPQFTGYSQLFRRIGESSHQSCLILTSREQPQEIRRLQGITTPVRVLHLTGLQASASQLLTARGVTGTATEIQWLIDRYQGHPLALELVAATIIHTFQNSITAFSQSPIVFGEIEDLIASQCDRLSPIEQSVIYWLAIHREAVTAAQLATDLLGAPLETIVTALDSLFNRSLLQKTDSGCTLQNVVMEYVSQRFIHQIQQELRSHQFNLFRTHAILQTTAKEYIRETQKRLLMEPIARELQAQHNIQVIADKFRYLIETFQTEQTNPEIFRANPSELRTGYAIGNLINLLLTLGIDLTGYDFSGLPIAQAYLQGANLTDVNFSHCHFTNTVFSQSLGSIFTIVFSPDQKTLVTGGMDGYIRIWRIADGQQLQAWSAHSNWIRHLTFSPDGQYLASSSNDRTIKIWAWPTDPIQCQHIFRGHQDWVWSSRFITWRKWRFLISVSQDRSAKIWNLNLGKCIFTLQENQASFWSVAFSRSGDRIATSSATAVKLWSVWTRRCIQTFEEATRIRALAFSPNGKNLVGCDDSSIKIWDLASGQCLQTFPTAEQSSIWSLTFSPDNQQLISAGTDKIQIWNAQTWQPLTTLSEPRYRIRSIAHSPDRKMMAVGSDEQLVRLWDTRTGQPIQTFYGGANRIWAIAVSPHPSNGIIHLASGHDDYKIRIWNGQTGELLNIFAEHQGRIRSVAFSPSGKLLASASHDRTIKIWDMATGKCLNTWHGHSDWIWSVVFSQDDRTLISAADDRTILIWDTHTGNCQTLQDEEVEWTWAIAAQPLRQAQGIAQTPILAVTGTSQNIELWDLETRTIRSVLTGHQAQVRSMVFNGQGNYLASSSNDYQIKLWAIDGGQCLQNFIGHTKEVRSLTFVPASTTTPEILVSASDDLTIRLWHPETGECFSILTGHQQSIESICYSPDLQLLFSTSQDETIKSWNLQTQQCIQTLVLPKPYQKMNITGSSGLSLATQNTLLALGAVTDKIAL
jgi:WD40 repeat protein